MAQDVSAFGFALNIIASNTFPVGFPITKFADDTDPFDIPEITVADSAMGVNGDLIKWSKPAKIMITIAVIDGSLDDLNLSVLLEANRVGSGKSSALDNITISAVYPTGKTLTLLNGHITKGMTASSVSSAGRIKTKSFAFEFENRIGTGS